MNLELPFFNALMELRKFSLGLPHDCDKTIKILIAVLQKANHIDKAFLVDMYYSEVIKVKQILSKAKTPEFRSFHDKIFKHLDIPANPPQKVTLLFEQFIKGITYFEYQKNNANDIPIYHRLYSCGDGTELYRNDNMICLSGIIRAEKNRRKKLIERCYIERLIYDALYKHENLHFPATGTENSSQDKGHLFRLDLTRQDYETCFKNCQIHVIIEWTDGMPCQVTITRLKNQKETLKEVYRKSFVFDSVQNKVYEPIVECEKFIDDKKYFKLQTFKQETNWKKL